MAQRDVRPDVVHTSLQTRAIRTAELALGAMGRSWIPVRRDWRLNERHYGDLTGRNKAETQERFGAEQVLVWRRSYDVPPPPDRRRQRRTTPTTTSATPRSRRGSSRWPSA